MDVQKLSIWEAPRQIYSTKGKNMDLKRPDIDILYTSSTHNLSIYIFYSSYLLSHPNKVIYLFEADFFFPWLDFIS